MWKFDAAAGERSFGRRAFFPITMTRDVLSDDNFVFYRNLYWDQLGRTKDKSTVDREVDVLQRSRVSVIDGHPSCEVCL